MNTSTLSKSGYNKRPQSQMLFGGPSINNNPDLSSICQPQPSYIQSLKGHYEFESTNTLRNSVQSKSIPKGPRFVLEQKGSHFAEYIQPPTIFKPKVSLKQSMGKPPRIITVKSNENDNDLERVVKLHAHIKRDNLNIKVDEFLHQGRPLWTREVQKCSPGPDVYMVKSPLDTSLEKNENKPNKCLFGEPHQAYQRSCDVDNAIKVFDHSKHYQSTMRIEDPDIISPMDTSINRRRNFPAFTMPKSNVGLFYQEIKTGLNTPGPTDYDIQEDKIIRNMKSSIFTIPQEPRSKAYENKDSPGPGHYETQRLTSLLTKIENKNRFHQTYSENLSQLSTKNSTSYLATRPTSKLGLFKFLQKSNTTITNSLLQHSQSNWGFGGASLSESSTRKQNRLSQESQLRERESIEIEEEDSKDLMDDTIPEEVNTEEQSQIISHNKGQAENNMTRGKVAPWKGNTEYMSLMKELEHIKVSNSEANFSKKKHSVDYTKDNHNTSSIDEFKIKGLKQRNCSPKTTTLRIPPLPHKRVQSSTPQITEQQNFKNVTSSLKSVFNGRQSQLSTQYSHSQFI